MLNYAMDYHYLDSEGEKLFTVVLLPDKDGKFPTMIQRCPYVDAYEDKSEEEICVAMLSAHREWLDNGYAVVYQHCRGRGKSSGDCIPYIHEREDGLNLQAWIRTQPFYNGELYLVGGSYLTSVHLATAPFAPDIKGASLAVQDSERYNICYRNGFMKKGLHGSWYVGMYKAKSHMKKNYTFNSFDLLPLSDFTKTVFGEPSPDFDGMLKAPKPTDEFWNTRYGGIEYRHATQNASCPILLMTGFNDIFLGGVFAMWNVMSESTRARSAFIVSPYDHSDGCDENNSIVFPNGKRAERFGHIALRWLNYVRGVESEPPVELGKLTYYSLFENKWKTEPFLTPNASMQVPLGDKEVSYVYNPYDPPRFKGGLSRNFGGTVFQDKPNSRHDIVSIYTEPFSADVLVKGKMTAKLSVRSDCEDTCFFVRISIEKERGDYALRDDITSLCYQLGDYTPDSVVDLSFEFDEHAFLIKKGERLRIDIASADNDHFVRHTNQKGLYSEQTTAKVAHNTVYLQDSYLTLPIEK